MNKINRIAQKLDKRSIGIFFGFLCPLISVIVLWQFRYGYLSFGEWIDFIRRFSKDDNSFMIYPILSNMILFYFSNFRLKMNRFTEGLVIVTVGLAFIVILTILL